MKIYGDIRGLGGEVLVVSFTPPPKVAAYLARYELPFAVVSDPDLAAYKSFGLERTTVGSLFRPSVIFHYLKLIFRGWLPRKPGRGEDVLQLGGDFVLDRERRLVYAHPSQEPTDRPTNDELLDAIRRAAAK